MKFIVYPNVSVVQFGYDGLGRRVFRQERNVVRYFYYDGERIIAEREGSSWVVRYLLGLRSCGQVVSGQVRVYHADRLGSVRWVTDGSGNLVASYVYEGFGKVVGQSGGGGGPYQFCGLWGYRNDQDAGLLHVGARYYEIETGRWVQKDLLLTLNFYVYCVNNPVNFIDPYGTFPWWLPVVLVGLLFLGGCYIGTESAPAYETMEAANSMRREFERSRRRYRENPEQEPPTWINLRPDDPRPSNPRWTPGHDLPIYSPNPSDDVPRSPHPPQPRPPQPHPPQRRR